MAATTTGLHLFLAGIVGMIVVVLLNKSDFGCSHGRILFSFPLDNLILQIVAYLILASTKKVSFRSVHSGAVAIDPITIYYHCLVRSAITYMCEPRNRYLDGCHNNGVALIVCWYCRHDSGGTIE